MPSISLNYSVPRAPLHGYAIYAIKRRHREAAGTLVSWSRSVSGRADGVFGQQLKGKLFSFKEHEELTMKTIYFKLVSKLSLC